jgi:4-amino-4-deoxy-L-arabinose transferase-like glycosyltransferase
MILVGSISIWNSVQITQHKEKFRSKDISSIAITSNFDHIQSLSLKNLYNNQGKFKPGVGGLNQYWVVIREYSVWSPFLLFAALGMIFLWRKDKRLAYWLLSWFASIFILFSMWINPYARYVLPLLPAVVMLSVYGMMKTVQWAREYFKLSQLSFVVISIVVITSFVVALKPLLTQRLTHVRTGENVYKAISYSDLTTLQAVASTIQTDAAIQSNKPTLLLMIGSWQSGLSETMMTHTNLKVIRFPRKPQEQASLEQLIPFIQQLASDYNLYFWYDDTANPEEQQVRQQLNLGQIISKYEFTFQPNVLIYRVSP